MAKSLGFLLLFAQVSLQQMDPVNNFCRRFGHQSCVIDRKLYIDGGQVNWNPVAQNYTSKPALRESNATLVRFSVVTDLVQILGNHIMISILAPQV
jgi:hypothetical protein